MLLNLKQIQKRKMSAAKKRIEPCPIHGYEFVRKVEGAMVCMAPTPGEISDHCWYHVTATRYLQKYCPDCIAEGIETPIEKDLNYCKPHLYKRQKDIHDRRRERIREGVQQ